MEQFGQVQLIFLIGTMWSDEACNRQSTHLLLMIIDTKLLLTIGVHFTHGVHYIHGVH